MKLKLIIIKTACLRNVKTVLNILWHAYPADGDSMFHYTGVTMQKTNINKSFPTKHHQLKWAARIQSTKKQKSYHIFNCRSLSYLLTKKVGISCRDLFDLNINPFEDPIHCMEKCTLWRFIIDRTAGLCIRWVHTGAGPIGNPSITCKQLVHIWPNFYHSINNDRTSKRRRRRAAEGDKERTKELILQTRKLWRRRK